MWMKLNHNDDIDECSFILVVNFCPYCQLHLGVINFTPAMGYDCPCAIFHTSCCQIYPYGHFHSQNEFSSMQIIAATWKIPVMYKILVHEYNLIHDHEDLDSIVKKGHRNYSVWSLTVSWAKFIHEQMCFIHLVFFSKFSHFPSPSWFFSLLFLHPLPISFLFLCPSRKSSSSSVFPKTQKAKRFRLHRFPRREIRENFDIGNFWPSISTGSSAEWDKPVTKWTRNEFFWNSHLRVSLVTLPSETSVLLLLWSFGLRFCFGDDIAPAFGLVVLKLLEQCSGRE